jgi:hypothetical protein
MTTNEPPIVGNVPNKIHRNLPQWPRNNSSFSLNCTDPLLIAEFMRHLGLAIVSLRCGSGRRGYNHIDGVGKQGTSALYIQYA